MNRALRALAVLVVLVTGLGLSPALAETPNTIWTQVAQESWHHTLPNVDVITNDPLVWNPMWSAGLSNLPDDSKASLNGVQMAIDTNLPVNPSPMEGMPSPQVSVNADGTNHFVWNLPNPLGENVGASISFSNPSGAWSERPGFIASRQVTPEILVNPVTDQVVRVTVRFIDELPPYATNVGIQIGVANQYGREFPLASGSVLSQVAVDGWDHWATGYQANWNGHRQDIQIGKPYEFQATLRSVRHEGLVGTPVFVPGVLISYNDRSSVPLPNTSGDSATTTLNIDSTHWMTATWSATPDSQYPFTWRHGLVANQRNLYMNHRRSTVVVGSDGTGTVSVPATSVVRVPSVDPESNGVLMVSVKLPDGYRDLKKGVGVASAEANGIPAKHASISGDRIQLAFDRQSLIAGATGGTIHLSISGRLNDGTVFSSQEDVALSQPAS